MPSNRIIDDKDTIRVELENRARKGATITYGQAAALVGRFARGLGPILDAIKDEEAEAGKPDLGCLVVNARSRFPSYVGKSETEQADAIALRQAVFKAHGFSS